MNLEHIQTHTRYSKKQQPSSLPPGMVLQLMKTSECCSSLSSSFSFQHTFRNINALLKCFKGIYFRHTHFHTPQPHRKIYLREKERQIIYCIFQKNKMKSKNIFTEYINVIYERQRQNERSDLFHMATISNSNKKNSENGDDNKAGNSKQFSFTQNSHEKWFFHLWELCPILQIIGIAELSPSESSLYQPEIHKIQKNFDYRYQQKQRII